jgi:hypothetical protein
LKPALEPTEFDADLLHSVLYDDRHVRGAIRDSDVIKLDSSAPAFLELLDSVNKISEEWAAWNSPSWNSGFCDATGREELTDNLLKRHYDHAAAVEECWPAIAKLARLLPQTATEYDLQLSVANVSRTFLGDDAWQRRTADLRNKLSVLHQLQSAVTAAASLDIAFGWEEGLRDWPTKNEKILARLVAAFKRAVPTPAYGYSAYAAARFVKSMLKLICHVTIEELTVRRRVQRLASNETHEAER